MTGADVVVRFIPDPDSFNLPPNHPLIQLVKTAFSPSPPQLACGERSGAEWQPGLAQVVLHAAARGQFSLEALSGAVKAL